MHSRLFDDDPISGTRRIFHYDPETGMATIETRQDVEDLIDHAGRRFRTFDERTPWKGDLHWVASIPNNILHELRKKGILDDAKAFQQWLNDRDNRVFRTRPGRV